MIHISVRVLVVAALFIIPGNFLSLGANSGQVPAELRPPANEQEILRVHAQGDQIYSCRADGDRYIWTLKAPEAQLTRDGKPFGKHFAGPSWKAEDGSHVTGKAAAVAPAPDGDSIPWLLVKVVNHSGEGVLAPVTFIQRVRTKGGKAPATGCDAAHDGQELRVPYSADYVFFAPK